MKPLPIFVVLVALTAGACCREVRPEGPPITDAAYPWTLRDARELPFDFMWQQSVEANFRGQVQRFDAVLQKQGDTLTLVGLTPFGAKAFVLSQRGTTLTFVSHVDRELPFPPRFMMVDIQRSYYPIASPIADGTTTTTRDGERVTEVWSNSLLQSRTYERSDGAPAGRITIVYAGWDDGAPGRVLIDNGWFGYRMDIRTTAAQRL